MADTIDVPQVGPVKKQYLIVAVAGVAGFVGYSYLKARKGASSSAATGAGSIDPNAVDPATGLTYGDELAAGSSSYSNPNPGATGSGSVSSTNQITTDTQWAQAVENDARMASYDPTWLGQTMGAYLDRQPLTSDQAAAVRSAWALYGHPPSNQPIVLTTTGGSNGGTGTAPATPHNLRWISGQVTKQSIGLAWDPVPGATDYLVHFGPHNLSGSTVVTAPQTSVTLGALQPGTVYWANVLAHNASGYSGGSNMLTNLKTLAK